MKSGQEGGLFNDGKVGVAYIEELRFSLYIERLQGHIEQVLDKEFKRYLSKNNIIIDETLYKLRLPEPSNFGTYRQQELDAALLNNYSSADNVPYLSKRFIMSRYLQLSDDEIMLNERMIQEERGIDPDEHIQDRFVKIYNPEALAGEEGDDLGLGGGGGGGLGGGLDLGPPGGAGPTEETGEEAEGGEGEGGGEEELSL